MKFTTTSALVATMLLAATTPAQAVLLMLEHSGTFTNDSTLGGSILANGTPFSFTATFDSSADLFADNGEGRFDTIVTFEIVGAGTFTSDPSADLIVLLTDGESSDFPSLTAGLSNMGTTSSITPLFTTITPSPPTFDADTPTPAVYSGLAGDDSGLAFTIPLSGGAGDLVINGNTFTDSAVISAIPEPSAFLFGAVVGAIAGTNFFRRGRRQS